MSEVASSGPDIVDDRADGASDRVCEDRVTVRTTVRFLIGNRKAIEDIAACPSALWLGLALVMTGALARNYDTEDLLHEPWHLLGSPLASLGICTLLYGATRLFAFRAARGLPIFATWRRYLTLFWMTAPMAWLYAIPYERVLTEAGAVEANIWTLVIVSVWRVWLISRVGCVLFGTSMAHQLTLTATVESIGMLFALAQLPLPVIAFMGGIHRTPLSDADRVVATANLLVKLVLGMTLWIGGAATLLHWIKHQPSRQRQVGAAKSRCHASAYALAAVAFATLTGFSLIAQPEQITRHRIEKLVEAGDIDEAISFLSKEPPPPTPPQWKPPQVVEMGL